MNLFLLKNLTIHIAASKYTQSLWNQVFIRWLTASKHSGSEMCGRLWFRMIFNKHRSDSQMYRTMLDSTRYEGPLVRLIPGATRTRLVQNWRIDRRALCAEHILRAPNKATPLFRTVNNPLAATWRTSTGGGTIGKRHGGTRETGTPTLREVERREDKPTGFWGQPRFKDRVAPRTLDLVWQ